MNAQKSVRSGYLLIDFVPTFINSNKKQNISCEQDQFVKLLGGKRMYQNDGYHMFPLTLETHLETLSRDSNNRKIKNLNSLYQLLKDRMINILTNSRGIYVDYSYHDSSHSEKLIQIIERFLGKSRIERLSATDTFMLLICAYSHDYGMAKTYIKVYEILGSDSFKEYLEREEQAVRALDKDDMKAIKQLLHHLRNNKPNIPLQSLYRSILHVIQLYLRPSHADDVVNITEDFKGLFSENLQQRFIKGSEGISDICMCHGKDFESIMHLSYRADGIVGDDFHPRFIAAMIRLADLLDLDNSRFPEWFLKESLKHESIVPELSALHAKKHEAITHLLITDEKIDIEAKCYSKDSGFETAALVAEWTDSLKKECEKLVVNWHAIVQKDFGNAPGNLTIRIFVDGKDYSSSAKRFKMQMSQEAVMTLLEGTSIYQNRYVGIRELIQNAVDASLLQLWQDLQQNRYTKMDITKDSIKNNDVTLSFLAQKGVVSAIFNNYDINVEVIKNLKDKQIEIVIKDKGIGISLDDLPYIANIGSSSNNVHKRKIMKNMPEWIQPSGLFGIGLQSVFQISDCIEFYTRQHNQPERRIALYSYGRNRGRIEVNEVLPNEDFVFYNNSIPGTNAKIIINPDKIYIGEDNKTNSKSNNPQLVYFDNDFHNNERFDIIYSEICEAVKSIIRSSPSDYFRIKYQEIEQINTADGGVYNDKKDIKRLRDSYFINPEELSLFDTDRKRSSRRSSKRDRWVQSFAYGDNCISFLQAKGKEMCFSATRAFYWDEKSCTAYHIRIRPCKIIDSQYGRQVFLPSRSNDLYKVHYKFNTLSKTDSIYSFRGDNTPSHAGFINWDIYIFNKHQTKYLNIDRDRLKSGAISEEELLVIRTKILAEWCKFLCDDKASKSIRPQLLNETNYLLSILILFYQSCERSQFDGFYSIYGKNIAESDFYIGDEKVSVTDLWDSSKRFFTTIGYLRDSNSPFYECGLTKEEFDQVSDKGTSISLRTLHHFPHRLIQEIKISKCGDRKLCYCFHFAHAINNSMIIEMDDYARLLDYVFAIRWKDKKTRFSVNGIVKVVLKPDSKFQHLVVTKYPVNFRYNKDTRHYLNECIKSYILSPFDQDSVPYLNEYINDIANEKLKKELLEKIFESEMYSNCENYILKNSIYGKISPDNVSKWKDLIRREYTAFIINFCKILYRNIKEATFFLTEDINFD